MSAPVIAIEDPAAADIVALLQTHLAHARAHTPAGSGHALNVEALRTPDVTFLALRDGGALRGCVALKRLDARTGEIKSMHVAAAARGQGLGAALLAALEEHARAGGITRLVLETGRSEGFAASRRLYARAGFAPCPAFGAYADDPFSWCMEKAVG